MPSSKSFIVFLSILLISCSKKPIKQNYDYQTLIALEYAKNLNFDKSSEILIQIYDKTKDKEYLKLGLKHLIKSKQYKKILILTKNIKDKDILIYKAKALFYLKNYQDSLNILLQLKKTSDVYELIGNIYFIKKQYKLASKYYESSYLENKNTLTLIKLTDTLYNYLHQDKKAISYLKTYIVNNKCDISVCMKLFLIYQDKNDLDNQIEILKNIYLTYNKESILSSLIVLMLKKDKKIAINFLEKYKNDSFILFELYIKDKKYQKAIKVLKRIYKKTNDIDLFARINILEFIYAKNKKDVVNKVINNFKKVVSIIDNPEYNNFLGYLLIEYNIDIKNGIYLVKKALKKENSPAYLDSLAWGYYKNKECKKAYNTIIQILGVIDDDDVKKHFKLIKKCLKK